MAGYEFTADIQLDGISYPSSRGTPAGQRQYTINWIPKIKAANQDATRQAMLDPLELTTFHRGSGASRSLGIEGMVSYGKNIWTCDAGILLPGPEVTTVPLPSAVTPPRSDGVVIADGDIFAQCGQYTYRIGAGQNTPVIDLDMGAGRPGYSLCRFGTSTFLSNLGRLYERPDGGAWTDALLGASPVTPGGALGTVWWTAGPQGSQVTAQRLVAQFGANGLRYCSSSPRLDSSWTPGLSNPVIDVKKPIQRFATTLDHLYIATPSGLLDLDSSGLAPNLVPEAEDGAIPSGGTAAICRGGFAFLSAAYDLYMVAVSGQTYAQAVPISPMLQVSNETPIAGYGTDIVARGRYVIYSLYDTKNRQTWVCWGRQANSGGVYQALAGGDQGGGQELGPMVWNVAPIVTEDFKVTCMFISGLATDGPRLWMFGQTTAGAVQARWAPLAFTTPYADLRAGRGRRFATSCEVTLPSEDGGQDAIPKDLEEIQCESEALFGGNTISVLAAKEGDPVFSQLASFSSGPRVLAPIKQAFVTQRPTFKLLMSGSPLTPPVLRRLSIRWLPNPDLREIRKYVLQVGRYERFGTSSALAGRGAMDSVNRLVALATAAARVTLVDEGGTAYSVRVLQIDGPAEVEADVDGARVLACSVMLSIFGRQPGPPFNWDAGVAFDSGRSWS